MKQTNDELFTQLLEMNKSMKDAVTNLTKVTDGNNKLIDLIEKNDVDETFKDFVAELKKNVRNQIEQKTKLLDRILIFDRLLNNCKSDEKIKTNIIEFTKVIGMFNATNE